MTLKLVKSTGLWKRSLEPQEDSSDSYREEFAICLEKFRERTETLVSLISSDMKDYTVHDISHLDALWEMASIIAGENFELNPAEAFVFGGAVLMHDAGMTLAAYNYGLKEIKKTCEWQDISSSVSQKDKDETTEPPSEALIIQEVLRLLHAKKAEELMLQPFKISGNSEQLYLCEDSDMRNHFGELIGKVAHSHHWSKQQLLSDLPKSLGPFKNTTWSVDVMKVALLLRCADAAHIDHRRAPKLLMALTQPEGISKTHWKFQTKLAKPQVNTSRLLYTSTSEFEAKDIDAWHLCWEAIKVINKELSDASDYFLTEGYKFEVVGAVGADSASDFSKHVRVKGWKPVPTEIQVSDVPHLARTLGGRDLYSSRAAPLRELIQNSADAIEARVLQDTDFSLEEGKILIDISEEQDDFIILSVEDNGIGMSEKTMTNHLLDFGKSFWRSEAAREEFSGLQYKFHPRGRYGIGFFSVFMWAEEITVSSRIFSEGTVDARVLEFRKGLRKRPILRDAESNEKSHKFSTKTKLKIPVKKWREVFERNYDDHMKGKYFPRHFQENFYADTNPHSLLAQLTAILPINLYLNHGSKEKIVKLPNWKKESADVIDNFVKKLENITPEFEEDYEEKFNADFFNYSEIKNKDLVIGRATISPQTSEYTHSGRLYVYEKGIYIGLAPYRNVKGLIEGKAGNAARDRVICPNLLSNTEWIEKQKKHMSKTIANVGEAISCQSSLLFFNCYMDDQPLFLINRQWVSP
ncbi:MAG: ATP-binding protein, partial [Pseudomonadota bacterium]